MAKCASSTIRDITAAFSRLVPVRLGGKPSLGPPLSRPAVVGFSIENL